MGYRLIKDDGSAAIWVVSLITGNRLPVNGMYHVGLLQRLYNNGINYSDPMLAGELDICDGYLNIINPPAGLDVDALVAKLTASVDAADDDEVASILAAIGRIPGGSGADPKAVALEVEKILADDFAKINLNVDALPTATENAKVVLDAQAERLKS